MSTFIGTFRLIYEDMKSQFMIFFLDNISYFLHLCRDWHSV